MQGLATKFQLLKSVWDYDNGTEKVDNNNWEKKKKKENHDNLEGKDTL